MKKSLIFLSVLSFSFGAQASGDVFYATNPKWKTECSSCHVAYPVRLLPAESWRAIMGGLDKHFGTDASLDTESAQEILAFLEKNAGRQKHYSANKPPLRITETNWFRGEHDEVPARLWKDSRVKSAANCGACHTQADRGDFSEHLIRLPK